MSFLINPFTFAVAGGDFESIATVTSNGNATELTFSSIPSDFTHLHIRGTVKNTSFSADTMRVKFNGTSLTYSHQIIGISGVVNAGRTSGAGRVVNLPNLFEQNAVFVMDILDYASTSKNKTFRSLGGADQNTDSGSSVEITSGFLSSTSAITSLTFHLTSTAKFTSTTSISLYGIKAP